MEQGIPQLSRCTVQRRNGQFCDLVSAINTPFPICHRHIVKLIKWWALDGMDERRIANEAERASFRERDAQRNAARIAQGLVYYVREGDGTIKIGYTTNLKERLYALRILPENVLATEPGPPQLERMRHKQFKDVRLGRWERFNESPELMSHIDMLVKHHGPPVITSYVPMPA